MPDRAPDPELTAEQAYVDAAYARLDAMREAAVRVREAWSDVQRGGTHQARLERDIAYDITQRRLNDLDVGDAPLCFGRLDLSDATVWYVGRLSVDDADRTPLVVDWRAPVAEPFYRATGRRPMGVARRRHLLTRKGRHVVAIDDEVFDRDATEAAGLEVTGEGALMAALDRERTGRMGDIVATIQAEQDEAIRADLPGPLVVTGGPGTGKTAVALHRAAYLLYTHRRKLQAGGVLLIGPSPVFLRYIEQVLPALGEHEVQLTTIAGLKPRLRRLRPEAPAVAALKGDARLAQVVQRAVRDRQRALPSDLTVTLDGLRLRVGRRDSARIVSAAQDRRGTHNARRAYVARRLLDLLVARYQRALVDDHEANRLDRAATTTAAGDDEGPDPTVAGALARGEGPPPGWVRELSARLRRRPEVREALDRMWPVLDGPTLVTDLLGFVPLVASAAAGILSPAEQELLHRPWEADPERGAWTDANVALVDEADHWLGPVEAARTQRRRRAGPSDEELEQAGRVIEELGLGGRMDARSVADRYGDATDGRDGEVPELRTFGHVLVDEAQDVTAMQWRMLARRCRSGSMTIVGDLGQASRPGAATSWDEVLAQIPSYDPPRFAELTINYRTPREIMDVAARLLAVAAPTIEASSSVREAGEAPRFVAAARGTGARVVREEARASLARGGKVAVIAPADRHEALVAALADAGAAAGGPEAIDAPIAVLDANDAKGLEFDHVVVVEPGALVTADRAGLRSLYVTITRATRSLVVVHEEPLPEGLGPLAVSV